LNRASFLYASALPDPSEAITSDVDVAHNAT
jgi:hypothetical protein